MVRIAVRSTIPNRRSNPWIKLGWSEQRGAAATLLVVDSIGFDEVKGGKTTIGISFVDESHSRRVGITKRSCQLPLGPRDVVIETAGGVSGRVGILSFMDLNGEAAVGSG